MLVYHKKFFLYTYTAAWDEWEASGLGCQGGMENIWGRMKLKNYYLFIYILGSVYWRKTVSITKT